MKNNLTLRNSDGEDRRFFFAGSVPVTFGYDEVVFGCAVCYDLRFLELFCEYLHQGCGCLGFDAESGIDYVGRSLVCDPEGGLLVMQEFLRLSAPRVWM